MSLDYDRGLKARLYARHGVKEPCVIEAAEPPSILARRAAAGLRSPSAVPAER
jgi:hypothetical protein